MRLSNIKVLNLAVQETGTYNKQYIRPWTTHVSGHALDDIQRRVESLNGNPITGMTLAGISSGILSYSASPLGEVLVPNGMSERRLRFVLEVEIIARLGPPFRYSFQGYTSHCGITVNNAIDPSMVFYINSFTRLGRVQDKSVLGYRDIVTDSAHILNTDPEARDIISSAYKMRPYDLFGGIQASMLEEGYSSSGKLQQLTDTRRCIGHEALKSNRSNGIGSLYLAKVLDSYKGSMDMLDFGQHERDIYGRGRDLVHEGEISENEFFRALAGVTGFGNSTSFQIGDLIQIDPMASNVVKYLRMGPVQLSKLHSAGQTSYWNGANRETQVATALSNAIPAIMMDLGLCQMYFTASNHSGGGNIDIALLNYGSFSSSDLRENFEIFKRRVTKEVLFDISIGNQIVFNIDMNCDLYGETTIGLTLDSGGLEVFTVPQYCDALQTPVLTPSRENYNDLVNDIGGMMGAISETRTNQTLLDSLYEKPTTTSSFL